MKARHSIYRDIIIYYDNDLVQYSCTYKKYYFIANNIKEVRNCIDNVLSYEKVLAKRANNTN